MATTWEHPEFGRFTWDVDRWIGRIAAPGFDAFRYDYGDEEGGPDGTYELHFLARDKQDVPSDEAVALAQKVLADPAGIAAKVTAALWDDFHGRGPGSGMWWYGDLDQVLEAMEGEEVSPPEGPEDLLDVLQLSYIVVRTPEYGLDRHVIELTFAAPFEEEHNVGVLTDGDKVLGLGYSIDVEPFGSAGGSSEEE